MKIHLKHAAIVCCLFGIVLQLHSQGYIVPNGVITNFISGEISVLHNPADPSNGGYTGFYLLPYPAANTFTFEPVFDISVRVFFVSPNDPVSLQPILSQSYTELLFLNNYVFANGVPFYVGLYTGTQYATDGIYPDPLFGWAELENVNGTIYLLNSALEYQGGGIYAGTQTIIPTPEPSELALAALGTFLFAFRWRRNFPRV